MVEKEAGDGRVVSASINPRKISDKVANGCAQYAPNGGNLAVEHCPIEIGDYERDEKQHKREYREHRFEKGSNK